eukprot:TRINITY_DN8254_c0_g2_i2.p1 TRINITY_DN8254_c0_g2~~TRINITY_DN8254_c0_g2_i2.p1  ORF type:complete len:1173 (-),score=157.54 TRINITY_DN8254_c0_g2_i2:81-3317(-)
MEFAPLGSLDVYLTKYHSDDSASDDVIKKKKNILGILMGIDICCGAMFIHSHNAVHRDLKPHNLLVMSESLDSSAVRLKICDLGSTREYVKGHDMTSNDFTLAYMAPEMITETALTTYASEVDVYAIGMVLYQIWTGLLPFPGQIQQRLLQSKLRGDLPEFPFSLKYAAIRDLISHCWETEPSKRPLLPDIIAFLNSAYCGLTNDALHLESLKYHCHINPKAPSSISPTFHHLRVDYIPHPRNASFFTRSAALDRLMSALLSSPNNQDRHQIVALNGMGGVGKTSLAVECSYALKDDQPAEQQWIVRWIRGSSASLASEEYLKWAYELGFPRSEKQHSAVTAGGRGATDAREQITTATEFVNNTISHWQEGRARVLVVFDNVEHFTDIEPLLLGLKPHIRVLITTRNDKVLLEQPYGIHCIEVVPLDPIEARSFIHGMIGTRQVCNDEIDNLVSAVGQTMHRLATAMHTLQLSPSLSIESYTAGIQSGAEKVEDRLFSMLIGQSPLAWGLLQCISFLEPDFISMDVLASLHDMTREPSPADGEDIHASLKHLLHHSLVSTVEGHEQQGSGVRVHRLVQQEVQAYITHKPSNNIPLVDQNITHTSLFQQLQWRVLETLEGIMPSVVTWSPDIYQKAGRVHAHLMKMLMDESLTTNSNNNMFRTILSNSFNKLGEYQYLVMVDYILALYYFKRALEVGYQFFQDSLILASTLNNMADLYETLGRHYEALPMYQQALHIQQKQLFGDHRDVASSLNNVATTYSELGRQKEALMTHQQALQMRQRLFSGDHYDVGHSLNNIGETYSDLGRPEEALSTYQQALHMVQRLFPGDHPDTANCLNNVATTLDDLGRHEEALSMHQQALHMKQRIFSGYHPDLATSLNNIAATYTALGHYEEALSTYQQALHMLQNLFSGDHPDVATCLDNMAATYSELEQFEEALSMHQQGLQMRQRLFIGNHSDVATSMNNIAASYNELGRHEEALPVHMQALQMRQQLFSGDHPDVVSSFDNIAATYQGLGRLDEALSTYMQALQMRQRLFPGDHPDVATSINNVSEILDLLGRHEEARLIQQQLVSSGDQQNY